MIFVFDITTPHATPQESAVTTLMPVIVGTITKMSVWFPPGANGLAHIKFLAGLFQLFPSNEQSNFSSGGEAIEWDEDIEIDTEPAQLVAITWNDDTTYDHTISVRVVMQPPQQSLTTTQVFAALGGGGGGFGGSASVIQTGAGGVEIAPTPSPSPLPAPSPAPAPGPAPAPAPTQGPSTVTRTQNVQPTGTSDFLKKAQAWLEQLRRQFEALPPVAPNGPVPQGAKWWLRIGFVYNVPPPFLASDMGLGVVLIWAAPGYTGPDPEENYL